jgi:hypothetical protein
MSQISRRVLPAVAVTLAVAASLLTLTRGSQADSGAAAALAAPAPSQFVALQRPASTADRAEAGDIAAQNLTADMPQLQVSGARIVSTNSTRELVLIPRSDGVECLYARFVDGTSGMGCNTAGAVPMLITYGRAVGVAPSGVTSVTFTLAGGATQTVAVDANGVFVAPPEAASVTFGSITVGLMPLSTAPRGASSVPL